MNFGKTILLGVLALALVSCQANRSDREPGKMVNAAHQASGQRVKLATMQGAMAKLDRLISQARVLQTEMLNFSQARTEAARQKSSTIIAGLIKQATEIKMAMAAFHVVIPEKTIAYFTNPPSSLEYWTNVGVGIPNEYIKQMNPEVSYLPGAAALGWDKVPQCDRPSHWEPVSVAMDWYTRDDDGGGSDCEIIPGMFIKLPATASKVSGWTKVLDGTVPDVSSARRRTAKATQ